MARNRLRVSEAKILLFLLGGIAFLAPVGMGGPGRKTAMIVHILTFASFFALVVLDLSRQRWVGPDRALLWVVGLLFGVHLLGSLKAPCQSYAVFRLAEVWTALLLMLLAQRLLAHGAEYRDWLFSVCIAATGFQALLCILHRSGGRLDHGFLLIPNQNHLSVYLAGGGALALGALLGRKGMGLRVLSGVVLALSVVGIVLSASRSGALSLSAGTVVLLARRNKLLLALPPLLLAFVILLPTPFSVRIQHLKQDVYAYERVNIWRGGLSMFADHPLTGVGVAQYAYYSPRYARPLHAGQAAARYGKTARHAHNEMLHAAAESGLMGLLPMFALLVLVLARCRSLWRTGLLWELAPVAGLVSVGAGMLFSAVLHQPCILYLAALLSGAVLGRSEVRGILGDPLKEGTGRLLVLLSGAGLVVLLCGLTVLPYAAHREFERAQQAALAGDLNRAAERAEQAIRLFPYRPDYHVFIAELILNHLGKEPDILAYHRVKGLLEEAVRLNPNASRAFRDLAELERKYFEDLVAAQELFDNGDDWYEKAIELNPYNGILVFRRATFNLVAGRLEAGEQMLRRAIELEPNFIGARLFHIRVLRSLGRKDEAREAEAALAKVRERMKGYSPLSEFERELLQEPEPPRAPR